MTLTSSRIKRGAKSLALDIVTSHRSSSSDPLSASALRMMKMGLSEGMEEGFGGGTKAGCCVSVDFDVTDPKRNNWNHDGTAELLRLSEAHGIPLTWGVCGRTAEEDQPAYQSILNSSIRQEIGVHTYSHIYAPKCTEAVYQEDISRCIRVLGLANPPKTFIFPKNREGHFKLLKRMGFTSFRGKARVIGAPVDHEGLWNIRPVYYVDQKSLGGADLISRFLDACIARSAVFHLWTHPWSLAIDNKVSKMGSEVFEPVFKRIASLRDEGTLSVMTMGGISDYMSRGSAN